MIIARSATCGMALALLALGAVAGSAVAQGMAPAPDFLVTKRSAYEFDETLNLLRQAIEAENLMLVQEVNPQKMRRTVGGQVGGMRQVHFFHPRYMITVGNIRGVASGLRRLPRWPGPLG